MPSASLEPSALSETVSGAGPTAGVAVATATGGTLGPSETTMAWVVVAVWPARRSRSAWR